MLQKIFNSVVFQIGAMLFVISFVSIISMFSSVYISDLADQDALAINHAGSMRMQSYKIFSELVLLKQNSENQEASIENLKQSLHVFDQKLSAPVLNNKQIQNDNPAISEAYKKVSTLWFNELSPKLDEFISKKKSYENNSFHTLNKTISDFVSEIDQLVFLYQQHAESRITSIRMIQGVALFLTVILVALTLTILNRRIEKPLSELTQTARKIMSGDYTSTISLNQNDELGLLSSTMNKMSNAISLTHSQLEKRVNEKTKALRQSNDSLQLLYQIAQKINHANDRLDLEPLIKKLADITELTDLDLCLMTSQGNAPYEHIVSIDKAFPQNCVEGDCSNCITERIDCGTTEVKYPLLKDHINYGVLLCNLKPGQHLESWQHQLFSSVADQIATGLSLKHQNEQKRRISLLTERNTIARELHDSLAQALSYLKIQVTRLQKLRKKDNTEQQIDEVVEELKSGLGAAYRELRELLTTFRLRIDNEGLQQAFVQTVQQLNERADGKMKFQLNYKIGGLPLTPNEEIHLMQIAREATQNALNHSKASHVFLTVKQNEDKNIQLTIEDDGVGMPDDPSKLNHYGLAIMTERSTHLNGKISIESNISVGTKVELKFFPSYLMSSPQKSGDTTLAKQVH